MIVLEKNEGAKIPFDVTGTKVCFDDDLTINLAKREEDDPVHIDVCHDADGALVIGAAAGRTYVAELDIPAREYVDKETEEKDMDGKPVVVREPLPLNMEKVTLTLWAVE